MTDPVTLGVLITGLVGAYKAYADYKAATVKAQAAQQPAPVPEAAATQGEQAAPLIKAAVQQHGDAKEQQVLANFEDDPELYAGALQALLTRLAGRSPACAAQLQAASQHANLQGSGVQGNVNVAAGGKVEQATGINYGTITYHAGKDE